MFCSLRYRIIWNPCFSFEILYLCLSRQGMFLWCAPTSAEYLAYQICNCKNSWRSFDTHFQDIAESVSLLSRPLKAANISSMDICNKLELRLPKMQIIKFLMLHWNSFSELGNNRIVVSFANTSCQCIAYAELRWKRQFNDQNFKTKIRWCFLEAHFNVFSIQPLLPSIIVCMMIWTY